MNNQRTKMKLLVEDMLAGAERRQAAEQRIRNERFQVLMWLANRKVTLANGKDLVTLRAFEEDKVVRVREVRGVTYFFDVLHEGRCLGHGHVCWHAGKDRPFRELDWHLNLPDGTETYELGEELWRRARLDRQLPRRFRKGYRSHSKRVLEALDAEYVLDECG